MKYAWGAVEGGFVNALKTVMLNTNPKLKAAILSITTVFVEFIDFIKQG